MELVPMKVKSSKTSLESLGRHLVLGVSVAVALVLGAGGWVATTEVSGAVVAVGSLVVDGNVKKVQHPTGGVVGEIRARDGDRVKAGDLLVRLDDTITKANLAILVKSLDELTARKARLESEQDGLDILTFPHSLSKRASDPDVARILSAEQRLFQSRRSARKGQKAQLSKRIEQLREEINGQSAQLEAKNHEIELIERELKGTRELWTRNLVTISKLTSLEREAARLIGEKGQLTAAVAQSTGKIAEIDLQILQIDRDLSTEVGKDLREADAKIVENVERKAVAEDQLKRIDIRAPQDGIVHQSEVHTVGGVIKASDTLMLVVPAHEKLMAEVKINPQDVDQVRLGQRVLLRLTAFNQRTTPEFVGEVNHVSADKITDQRTGRDYYTALVNLLKADMNRLNSIRLVPGMPVEAFIQNDDRTVLSYLTKPVDDQIRRAFRER